MAKPAIYLASTPPNLWTHRVAAKRVLEGEGCHVLELDPAGQTDWQAITRSICAKLRDADLVVHLVGIDYGDEPAGLPPGELPRSHGQMEYHLAQESQTPCHVVLLSQVFPYDPAAMESHEAHASQSQHRDLFLHEAEPRFGIADPLVLEWRLQTVASEVRQACQNKRRGTLSAWLMRLPLLLVITAMVLQTTDPARQRAKSSWLTENPARSHAVLGLDDINARDEAAVLATIGARRLITELAAAAASGGSITESYDAITRQELALDSIAVRHHLGVADLRRSMDDFTQATAADPVAPVLDRALASFAEGKYRDAADSARLGITEAAMETSSTGERAFHLWMLKGHAHHQLLEYPAALAAYGAAMALAEKSGSSLAWGDAALLTSRILIELARWDDVRPLLGKVVALREKHLSRDAPSVGLALCLEARLCLATHRYAEAAPLLERALSIQEKNFGPEHPEVVAVLNVMGEQHRLAGKPAEAEAALCRAIAIEEKRSGVAHSSVARQVSSLAILMMEMQRPAVAVALCDRALSIDEKAYGPEHPRVARDLDNLASIMANTSGPEETEPLLRRCLGIREKAFGPGHPDVALSLHQLSSVLQLTQGPAVAEPLLRRALAIDEEKFGPDHPHVLRDLRGLSILLRDADRPEESLPVCRRVLAIAELNYGADDPEVGQSLSSLAATLGKLKQHEEEEAHYRRALAITEEAFGPEDFRLFLNVRSLAHTLRETGQREGALQFYRRALAMARRNLGEGDPGLAEELENLAGMLRETREYSGAESLYREALVAREKSLDPTDPELAGSLNNLASVLHLAGRHAEAEPLYRRVVEIVFSAARTSGQPHPFQAAAEKNYRTGLRLMGLTDGEIAERIRQAEAGE